MGDVFKKIEIQNRIYENEAEKIANDKKMNSKEKRKQVLKAYLLFLETSELIVRYELNEERKNEKVL